MLLNILTRSFHCLVVLYSCVCQCCEYDCDSVGIYIEQISVDYSPYN